jgi:choline/glycine/proline betaine transport protein
MLDGVQERLGLRTNPTVFIVSAVLILGFVVFGAVFTSAAERVFTAVQTFITTRFGWFYILCMNIFLVFCLYLGFSRFGNIRLGPDDARPEYSYPSWFAMLFGAGMGIGVLFWSVAEPVSHYLTPARAQPETMQAAREAVTTTYLHWGLHGWGVYVVVGLSLAYFAYRHDLPLSLRSALYPLFGDRVRGRLGDAVDIFAVLGTMFGVATSLGLGAQQIAAGLNHLFGISGGPGTQVILIVLITAAATASVVAGLDSGIKRLSNINLYLAAGLFIFVILAGKTALAFNGTLQSIGTYLYTLPFTGFWSETFINKDWQADWTLFYWGWWIAWSPFVGVFVARISRGRTIREFVLGVLLVPTLVTFVWFGVFGSMGLDQVVNDVGQLGQVMNNGEIPLAIFVFFEQFPLSTVVSVVGVAVVVLFFVTSSDSASFVIDMLTAGGDLDPPKVQRVFWATTEGAVGAVLLLTGGLIAMQTFQLTTGLPLALILLAMCVSLHKALVADLGDAEGLTEVADKQPWATVEQSRADESIDSW